LVPALRADATGEAPGDADEAMLSAPLPAVTPPAPQELLQLLGRSASPLPPPPTPLLTDPEALWAAAAAYVAEARAEGWVCLIHRALLCSRSERHHAERA
jgi:hypothetical protein